MAGNTDADGIRPQSGCVHAVGAVWTLGDAGFRADIAVYSLDAELIEAIIVRGTWAAITGALPGIAPSCVESRDSLVGGWSVRLRTVLRNGITGAHRVGPDHVRCQPVEGY
jgi:hypothetical protein